MEGAPRVATSPSQYQSAHPRHIRKRGSAVEPDRVAAIHGGKPSRTGLVGPASMPLDDHSAIHQGGVLPRHWQRPQTGRGRGRYGMERCGKAGDFRLLTSPRMVVQRSGMETLEGRFVSRVSAFLGRSGLSPTAFGKRSGEQPEPDAPDGPRPLAVTEDGGPDSRVHRRARRGIGRWTRSPSTPVTPGDRRERGQQRGAGR